MRESVFSYFNAPITNQRPSGVVNIGQLHAYITANEWLREQTRQVRAAKDDPKRFAALKRARLPYVTPAGVFDYRKEERLRQPSGLLVIDIDHLASAEEAAHWRDTLFDDGWLRPDLAFVSPSETGVKLLLPYRLPPRKTVEGAFDEALNAAWDYLRWRHGLNPDTAGADLARACFLCHDPGAKATGASRESDK